MLITSWKLEKSCETKFSNSFQLNLALTCCCINMSVPSNKEIEAQELLERADKKATSFSLFGLLGGQQSK